MSKPDNAYETFDTAMIPNKQLTPCYVKRNQLTKAYVLF